MDEGFADLFASLDRVSARLSSVRFRILALVVSDDLGSCLHGGESEELGALLSIDCEMRSGSAAP